MPGFPRVLISVAEAYRERQDDITRNGYVAAQRTAPAERTERCGSSGRDGAARRCVRRHDQKLRLGQRRFRRRAKVSARDDARVSAAHVCTHRQSGRARDGAATLARRWRDGGMYDQLGGGFHRYSTDARWLVPHFEKMLYDNALLSRLYLHYFQVSARAVSARDRRRHSRLRAARDDAIRRAAFIRLRMLTPKVMKESFSSGTSSEIRRCAWRNAMLLFSVLTTTSPKAETSKARTFRTSLAR